MRSCFLKVGELFLKNLNQLIQSHRHDAENTDRENDYIKLK